MGRMTLVFESNPRSLLEMPLPKGVSPPSPASKRALDLNYCYLWKSAALEIILAQDLPTPNQRDTHKSWRIAVYDKPL